MNTSITNKGLIIGSLVVGIALVLAVSVWAYSFFAVKSLSNVISVTGSAEKNITSDMVKWTGGFSRNVGLNETKDGYAMMNKDLNLVSEYLKSQGITEKEFIAKPVMMNSNYESTDKYGSKMVGYTLQQFIEVQSGNVSAVTKLAQDAPVKLSELGVLFSSQGLEYYYNKFADLKVEMLAEATKNAKARAEKIAESTGSKIGFLQSANMGVFQVTPVNSVDVSDYGYFDTSSIEKKVTSVVRASFSLK
jgi:hypothetical protein